MIDRDAKPVAATAKATYYRDVLPILQNHCQTCHRPGESGPFSLMKYSQAVNWAGDLKDYTQKKIMPPWKPSAGVAMHHERRLTDKEIATIADWADHGTPAGDPKDAPPEKKFTEGWQLGTPDLVLTPIGRLHRRADRQGSLPLLRDADRDREGRVRDRRRDPGRQLADRAPSAAVHRRHRRREEARGCRSRRRNRAKVGDHDGQSEEDRGPGYTVAMGIGISPQGGLSGWSPGITPRYLPEGSGFYLPKNSDIVMQVHYHRDGRLEKDRTKIGLYFAKKPVENVYASGSASPAARGRDSSRISS